MEQNKIGKYLKYAIGEIVLVMIGILLALQVNTWREDYKTSLKEIKILRQLRIDLDVNKQRIQSSLKRLVVTYSSLNYILEQLKGETIVIDDSLKKNFSQSNYAPQTDLIAITYKFIQNSGLDVLSNDELRIAISDMHENGFITLTKLQAELKRLNNEMLNPFMLENFKPEMTSFTIQSTNTIESAILPMRVPKDISALRVNEKYLNILYLIRQKLGINGDFTKRLLSKLEGLLVDIDNEIENLD